MLTLLARFHGQFFRMTDKIVILSTCSTEEEAERLARLLVDARLAACVTVIPRMRSFYRWKGATESADECLLLIKSSRELFDSVRSRLETVHSYEVPELLALPVVEGAANYMDWLSTNLRKGGDGLSNKLQLETESLAAGLCLIFDMDGVIVPNWPGQLLCCGIGSPNWRIPCYRPALAGRSSAVQSHLPCRWSRSGRCFP